MSSSTISILQSHHDFEIGPLEYSIFLASDSLKSTAVQILCLLTFVVGNKLTWQGKISDNKFKSKGTACYRANRERYKGPDKS